MCKCGIFHLFIAIYALLPQNSSTFKVLEPKSANLRPKPGHFSRHIDDMMFECAIHRDKLTFPSNSNVSAPIHFAQGKETENLINKVAEEVERARIRAKVIQSNVNRIKFPILGRTTKPETKYLQKIYYILEENNRSLNENRLSENDQELPKKRSLFTPKNITKLFNSASVSKLVSIFPSVLSQKSPMVSFGALSFQMPGQESNMVLQEEHREFLVNEIRENNIFGIFLCFVSRLDEASQKPEITPNATLCELVDITDLDKTGRVKVRAVERFKIGNVLAISDAVIQAEVSLFRDSDPLRNPPMAQENSRIIEKLYDKCNLLESEYRKLDGNMDDFEKISKREKFADKIAKMIEHIDFEQEPNMIYELTAFAGLEFNADVETKTWACNTSDTEQRLIVTIDVLKTKINYLNGMIKNKSCTI